MNKYILCLLAITLMACKQNQSSETKSNTEKVQAKVTKSDFGKLPNGTAIERYTLKNANGVEASILTYGGIVQSLIVPDKKGTMGDVVLGHDHLQGYLDQNPYFGGIIGRYGNRIANGTFSMDSKEYTLATNDGKNHLHGGTVGFDKEVWTASKIKEGDAASVTLSRTSKDGEEGYPGNLKTDVKYTLTNQNGLVISYEATTDKATVVNLTNHSYFNLGDDPSSILGHQLQLSASTYLPVDETLIPTGKLEKVAGTPFDFTTMKVIGKDIEVQDEQLTRGKGYDHCWVIDEGSTTFKKVSELYDADSGRLMETWTTEPGIQFYSGNFLDGTIKGKGGTTYPFRSGLCLETQHYPDSPNQSDFPSTTLLPGEKYSTITEYRFITK